jgi:hypothetical protein
MLRPTDPQSQAVARIAVLTGVFEKLVAETGVRRGRIEQLLAEMAEDAQGLQPPTGDRAARGCGGPSSTAQWAA